MAGNERRKSSTERNKKENEKKNRGTKLMREKKNGEREREREIIYRK
jgi:hypothetical protein